LSEKNIYRLENSETISTDSTGDMVGTKWKFWNWRKW